jgi:hypothetical protein
MRFVEKICAWLRGLWAPAPQIEAVVQDLPRVFVAGMVESCSLDDIFADCIAERAQVQLFRALRRYLATDARGLRTFEAADVLVVAEPSLSTPPTRPTTVVWDQQQLARLLALHSPRHFLGYASQGLVHELRAVPA